MLNKNKYSRSAVANNVDPFGARFLTRIERVNNKLTCNLSRAAADPCTDELGTDCLADWEPPEEPIIAR